MTKESARRRIDEIGDESRRRILDAAESLFAEQGFENTSFIDVAERSGISRGSIPWHFKNKDGLLVAVVERATARSFPTTEFGPGLASASVILKQVAQFLSDRRGDMFYMLLAQALTSDGLVHDQYVDYYRRRRAIFEAQYLASRPKTAKAKKRASALATALNGAIMGIELQWAIDPDGVDLDASLEVLAQLIDRTG